MNRNYMEYNGIKEKKNKNSIARVDNNYDHLE